MENAMCDRNQEAVNAKLAYEQQAGQTIPMGIGASQREIGPRESVMKRLRESNREHEKLNKAARILEMHPEFEDMIWLIHSGVL